MINKTRSKGFVIYIEISLPYFLSLVTIRKHFLKKIFLVNSKRLLYNFAYIVELSIKKNNIIHINEFGYEVYNEFGH